MQKKFTLKLLPSEAADEELVKQLLSVASGKPITDISGYTIEKKSVDARRQKVFVNLTVNAFIGEPMRKLALENIHYNNVSSAKNRVIVIGAGPAGLFAALKLLELGIKPVIIERGKDVRSRRRDLARLNKEGIIDSDSNYCFGEGGAGTYSDGKLYTRSTKRGNIQRILEIFVRFGAGENILFEAHPHIGTNKLPQIISNIRQFIIDQGGEILFEKKLVDFIIDKQVITAIKTADGDTLEADAFILATGHSARDVFHLLLHKRILIEAKPFALGVRVEHPQQLIDSIQYHCAVRDGNLPPASYSLVQQVENKGVFSFCMCPGGIIAPASTDLGELVVNGWSPSKRNNPFANSGIVVQTELENILQLTPYNRLPDDPLVFMRFQQQVEQHAFEAGGGKFIAPAQRMTDFVSKKISSSLPANSYLPGLRSALLRDILPPFIDEALTAGLKAFGKKMKGYFTSEAVVVATESRTSSPVRIPRDQLSLQHPQIRNLYPCGEGAGYAGGIVSAAIDGERIAAAIKIPV